MPPLKSLMAPRARGSRKFLGAKTPEPFADADNAQPQPAPRPRFRLRRRNPAAQRDPPTQQFLASVAVAADVPIPSIEEPRPMDDDDDDNGDGDGDEIMATPQPALARRHLMPAAASASSSSSVHLELPHAHYRDGTHSPRTPVPRVVPSLSPKRFPDWSVDQAYSSLESSSECESSRPSTAQSTQTSASLFSRYSANSDGFSLLSIDPEDFAALAPIEDPEKTIKAKTITTASASSFSGFSASDTTTTSAANTAAAVAAAAAANTAFDITAAASSSSASASASSSSLATAIPSTAKRRSRKAPWTRLMYQHLWSTYMMYLQDPHVTPFRVSKAGIPPQGVCMRVAREAKRSWKGTRSQTLSDKKSASASASATPTAESSGSFVMWPHSCSSTRAQLRSLCQLSAGSSGRNHPCLAQRATLFGRTTATRIRNRRSTPSFSPQAFSGSDMALSLAVSTCESMQPRGPLAQLTASGLAPAPVPAPAAEAEAAPPPPAPLNHLAIPAINALVSEEPIARLGSPFTAKSYGPSSSEPIKDVFGAALEPRRKSHTAETRRSLRSPAKLSTSTSRPGTQKRRSRQTPVHPDPRRKRPSLSLDIWKAPSSSSEHASAPTTSYSTSSSISSSTSSSSSSSSAVAAAAAAAAVPITSASSIPPLPLPALAALAPLPLPPTSFPGFAPTSHPNPSLIAPRTNIQQLFDTPRGPAFLGDVSPTTTQDPALAAPAPALAEVPRRLGSPFAAAMSSFSFPNRSSSISAFDFGVIRRPFTTANTNGNSNSSSSTTTTTTTTSSTSTGANNNPAAAAGQRPAETAGATSPKPSSLLSRLAYIDERLKDLRRRSSPTRRRSRSPL